eukprot:COSAG02_NODE_9689_length_2140_cov_2.167565_3_plen_51_part_00
MGSRHIESSSYLSNMSSGMGGIAEMMARGGGVAEGEGSRHWRGRGREGVA